MQIILSQFLSTVCKLGVLHRNKDAWIPRRNPRKHIKLFPDEAKLIKHQYSEIVGINKPHHRSVSAQLVNIKMIILACGHKITTLRALKSPPVARSLLIYGRCCSTPVGFPCCKCFNGQASGPLSRSLIIQRLLVSLYQRERLQIRWILMINVTFVNGRGRWDGIREG